MASGLSVKPNGYRGTMLVLLLIASSLIELATCHKKPRLEILPAQSVQKKPIGKSLLMTCQPDVTDSSLITDLQWKDNRNLTVAPKQAGNNSPSMYTEVLPGNQALALLIPYLTESMAGHYYCTASYASTELLDVSVVIETYVAITWKNAPENQFPILGEDFSIKCDVTASPAPSVDWIRNGDQVKTGGRYVVETHGLLIRDVQESDDGIYTCRAAVIQTGELVERNIRVEVYIKPQVIEMPKAIELVDGQPFTVKCNATGKPPPEYTWVKVQSQQNMATADRFRVNAQTGEMNILQVQKDDYGMYICRATNAAGFNDEETLLDVLVRPNIHELINVTLDHNKEGSILCKATGRPPPEITFRRWGSTEEFILGQQPEDDRITLLDNVNRERGESSATLRFDRVLRSDDGLYECIARNKGDTAYKVGHIAVQFAPTFEHMRKLPPVYSWDERKANLSCLAEGIPNATIEWRRDDRPIKDLFDKNLEIEGTGPRSNLIINPIGRQYYRSYKCIATNILGRDEIDMHLRLATIPPLIGQAIPRLITATTMTFDIVPPPIEDGMPLTAFTCSYKDERNPDWAQAIERTWSPDSPYIIEGLRPQTSYTFRFAASNLVGRGQWSAAILLATPKRSAPEQPKTLHAPADESDTVNGELLLVTSPYSDHFELRWSKPLDNGEPIDYYQIKYCLGHKVNGEWREHENQCQESEVSVAESTSYEMGGLQGDSLYRIELRAHNAIGYSEPSNLMLKTVRGVDVVLRVDRAALSSAAIVGIAVGGVILLLIFIDFMCCMIVNAGVMAALCRRSKRSPSDIDEENKLGREEKQPLNTPTGSIKINSSVDFDGKVVHSRSGEILGKNSSV